MSKSGAFIPELWSKELLKTLKRSSDWEDIVEENTMYVHKDPPTKNSISKEEFDSACLAILHICGAARDISLMMMRSASEELQQHAADFVRMRASLSLTVSHLSYGQYRRWCREKGLLTDPLRRTHDEPEW